MIPLRDKNPTRTVPFVNYLLIAANIVVFMMERGAIMGGYPASRLVFDWGLVPARFLHAPLEEAVTIFTSLFMHDPTGWLHIGGNMLFLYIFGDNVEDRLGHFRYLVFYLACGVSASLCHAFFNASSVTPTLGASGAISGVLAAYLFLYPRARILTLVPLFLFFTTEIPAFVFIVFWFVIQFFSGTASLRMSTPTSGGTAYFAHIGGFLAGILLLAILKPRRSPLAPAWRSP
jgi:membrane associated rhomboid family serine protease